MPVFEDVRMIIAVSIGIAILIIMTLWIVYRRKREYEDPFDSMEGEEFEKYCVELLTSQGYEEVCQTQSSHDYGIDIFADKDGISYAIQCKCYSTPIGIKAIQEAYAGRDYYDCMVGVVMTNQYFTKPAVEYAAKLNILLWDADVLSDMIFRYGGAGYYSGAIRYSEEAMPVKGRPETGKPVREKPVIERPVKEIRQTKEVKEVLTPTENIKTDSALVRMRKNLARAIARQKVKKQKKQGNGEK